ncbi:C-C motif chemokine 4-like [Tiliqua scincoides]|uniref:C-C motif chemokine 4-like n=1 Tax=Tiliqua scincoides TaxID=71010 RepID=UPI003462020D
MKTPATASCTALLLLLALCSSTFSAPALPPVSCCDKYTGKPLPRRLIKDYYESSSRCPQPAVVFITIKGRGVCANPREQWVQDRVNDLQGN